MLQLQLELERQEAENVLQLARMVDERRRLRRRRRRYWVRPWISRRDEFGFYGRLMRELEAESEADFKNLMRMEPAMFRELLERIGPRITKADTTFRNALQPGLKLAITLRHLATGESYHSLSFSYRVPHNTISLLLKEVTEAIIEEYAQEVVSFPTTQQEWHDIGELFGSRWNFHHALGALDGKHIAIRNPPKGGSVYYNYKGYFSIILMALVDADYKFIWVDVGANGSASDGSVFNASELKEACESGDIGFPDPEPLPNDDKDMPYFIIGDDAFPLKTWLMKPFSRHHMDNEERIFNYRLSRARRIVENAFGILANRFQCLLTTMRQDPKTVGSIVLACCCLHNLMRLRFPALQNAALDQEDAEHQVIPGAWREDANLDDMQNLRGTLATREARLQRTYLKHYYNSPAGSVPWQNDMI